MRKKQNGGWKLSDTDWFYFSFYNLSWFFYDLSWSEFNFILFLFFYSIRVDPVRLLYLPIANRFLASYKEPQAPDPTEEQLRLLDISGNNNLASLLFEMYFPQVFQQIMTGIAALRSRLQKEPCFLDF